jgi:hypothetical protein
MKRRVIVTCTREIANLLKAGKALGVSYVSEREVFDRDEIEVKLESASFSEVPPGKVIPRATLEGNPDGTLRVVPL